MLGPDLPTSRPKWGLVHSAERSRGATVPAMARTQSGTRASRLERRRLNPLNLALGALIGLAVVLSAVGCRGGDDGVAGTRGVSIPVPTGEGRAVEGFAPDFEVTIVPVGLGAAETLPLRAFAGNEQSILADIPAAATGLAGLDGAFETPDGMTWWLVSLDGRHQGWVKANEVAYPGASRVVSVDVAGRLDRSVFASPQELALTVAEQYRDRAGGEVAIVSITPAAGEEPAVVLVDVTGLADDSVSGTRLEVIARTETPGEYRITAVNETPLCARGVTGDGLCL